VAEGAALDLRGLLAAESAGQLIGAALYVTPPGGVALVWPPAVIAGESYDAVGEALLAEVCRGIDESGCSLGQCLVESGSPSSPLLERHGFLHLTELVYLERALDGTLPAPPAAEGLVAEPYDPGENHARFAALLEATYAHTLDCPELNGTRSAVEALAGHRAAGCFDPRLWQLYRAGSGDLGLILLTDHPELNVQEVVYMGVAPASRGRGLGRTMLTRALEAARDAGREAVLLGVDVRNRPARRLYERLGFVELCRRAIHLRRRP
jgi:GNAT superfamily N-acetyltransferase